MLPSGGVLTVSGPRRGKSRKALAVVVALAMLLAMTPMSAQEASAESGDINMSNPTPAASGTNWTYDSSDGAYTITGDVTVTGDNGGSDRHLEIPAGPEVSITLENAIIDVSSYPYYKSPLDLNVGANVNLIIKGTNCLTARTHMAGIHAGAGATLSISGSNLSDTLTAIGGTYAAGIGGGDGESGGTITISGGTVNATGEVGAGIGGGAYRDSGTITISGGTVNATSRVEGAGIGGGFHGDGGTITISGGTVNVISGAWGNGAGIGGGDGGSGGTITISGGTVNAINNHHGAGIGGGDGGSGGTITISGGTVNATSISYGAGIGGGENGDGGTITISGGAVNAISSDGAGIGGGVNGSGGNIVICNEATVTVAGGAGAIGGGSGPGDQFIAAVVNTSSLYEINGSPTLPENLAVNIPAGQTMAIPEGSTLTVKGTLDISGTLNNEGSLDVYGTLNNEGTLNNNGSATIRKGGVFNGNIPNGNLVKYVDPYTGADVSKPAVNGAPTELTIRVNPATLLSDTGQQIEYAISTEQAEPQGEWQGSATFTVLTPGTAYYVFARSKANNKYLAGKASVSDPIATKAVTTETPVLLRDIPGAKTPVEAGTTARLPKSVIFDDLTRADVTWTSADQSIAAIDPYGNLIGVKEGKTTLTATAKDGKTQTVAITVAKNVTTIRTPQKAIHMQRGQALTPPVCADSMNPATNKADTTAKLTWSSSNPKIATVNAATGKIKAKKSGKAKITATALNGEKLTITVNVTTKAIPLKTLTLKKAPTSLQVGKARLLSVKATPYQATNLNVTFSSSNRSILSVDKVGKITAKKKGKAKITIKAAGKKYAKIITVK